MKDRSQSLLKSGRYLQKIKWIDYALHLEHSRNPFLNQVVIFKAIKTVDIGDVSIVAIPS